ncbi:GGDEF domain-containing protein [Ideonella benzenivorans]|uniref:GGDEF domain-containing protein n=1 Tax=Ideonella benzenivorans TaxID=2831643 RepID=UPI001CED8E79|nr:GGDEF domain-containing protein [Ideonella benzenivorans]
MSAPTRVTVGFLILQALLIALSGPTGHTLLVYGVVLAAALLALGVTLWRAQAESVRAVRWGWGCVAASLLLWCGGQAGNLWWEWGQGQLGVLNRAILLVFHLAAVPLLFLLARPGLEREPRQALLLDGAQALLLALSYYWWTWGTLDPANAHDAPAVATQLWLMDAQNLYLLLGSLVRWRAASPSAERNLYRVLSLHLAAYALAVALNNHLTSWRPDWVTPGWSSLITLPFLLLACLAWPGQAAADAQAPKPPRRRAHLVRSISPLMLSGTLMLLALLLIRVDYAWGVAGVLLAALSSAARGTLAQLQQRLASDSLRRQRQQLARIAWTDALTGIPNRHHLRHVLERLEQPDRRQPQPHHWTVLMIDIDHFKQLNDQQGHRQGDACLRQVAQALHNALARPGDLLVRYGGEEFLALMPNTAPPGAPRMAERLRAAVEALALAHPAAPGGRVTVSVGWASHTAGPPVDFDALITQADQALYRAKRDGRNRVAGAA